MTVINVNSVSGITSISSNTTAAVKFFNSAGTETLGDVSVSSINGGPLSGFRNRIINGDMRLDQRNAGVSTVVAGLAGAYTLDRWEGYEFTDGAATIVRSATTPVGFTSSLLWTTTTADSALTGSQFAMVQQKIEGNNVSDLEWGTSSAETVTLSFYVRSSLTGTFDGQITNDAKDRSYVFNYTIDSANTWEYKTVTIPGDTTGTWKTTQDTGIAVRFTMGCSSTFVTTPEVWVAGNFGSTTGGTSVIGTLNATWYVTGVQFEIGSIATPFERRNAAHELVMCQRYYYKTQNNKSFVFPVAGGYNSFQFKTTMRISPNVTVTPASGATSDLNTNVDGFYVANSAISAASVEVSAEL